MRNDLPDLPKLMRELEERKVMAKDPTGYFLRLHGVDLEGYTLRREPIDVGVPVYYAFEAAQAR